MACPAPRSSPGSSSRSLPRSRRAPCSPSLCARRRGARPRSREQTEARPPRRRGSAPRRRRARAGRRRPAPRPGGTTIAPASRPRSWPRARLADAVILDADGALVHPAPPAMEPAPPGACLAAARTLASPEGATRRGPHPLQMHRSSQPGGALPVAAPRARDGHRERRAGLARAARGAPGPADRDVLRARVASLSDADRARAERALARTQRRSAPPALLAEAGADDAEQGGLRTHRGRWVGLLRRGPVRHPCRLRRARSLAPPCAPGLPPGLALALGATGDGSEVRLSPLLALHVASRDPPRTRRRRAGRRSHHAGAAAAVALALGWRAALRPRAQRAALRRSAHGLRGRRVARAPHAARLGADAGGAARGRRRGRGRARRGRGDAGARGAAALRTLDRMLRFGSMARGKLVAARTRVQVAPIARAAAERFRAAHPERELELDLDDALRADCDAGLLGSRSTTCSRTRPSTRRTAGRTGWPCAARGRGGPRPSPIAAPASTARRSAASSSPSSAPTIGCRRATEGSGIGLSLVRGIARAHGGARAWRARRAAARPSRCGFRQEPRDERRSAGWRRS